MAKQIIKVPPHDRSKPSTPAYEGNYPKPGPKTVPVEGYTYIKKGTKKN